MFEASGRRRHRRHKAKARIKYALADSQSDVADNAVIDDISYGGVKLIIKNQLKKHIHLFVEIISKNLNVDIAATGKVVWMKKDKNKELTICGIKFDWISDKNAYEKYIERCELAEDSPRTT